MKVTLVDGKLVLRDEDLVRREAFFLLSAVLSRFSFYTLRRGGDNFANTVVRERYLALAGSVAAPYVDSVRMYCIRFSVYF